jgi:hypothetical protein
MEDSSVRAPEARGSASCRHARMGGGIGRKTQARPGRGAHWVSFRSPTIAARKFGRFFSGYWRAKRLTPVAADHRAAARNSGRGSGGLWGFPLRYPEWSDRKIAGAIGTDHKTVAGARKRGGENSPPAKRTRPQRPCSGPGRDPGGPAVGPWWGRGWRRWPHGGPLVAPGRAVGAVDLAQRGGRVAGLEIAV